jgi:hypothetical protein
MPVLEAAEGVGSKERSPGLAAVDGGWYGSRGFPPRPPFRADPAREDVDPGDEDDGGPGGFEAPVAVVDQKPDLRRRPDMQSAAAASANAEVVAVTRAAKPVGLAGLFRRVREFVAGTRTPRPPDSPEDVGSAEPRPAAASVLVGSVEPGSLAASVLAPPAAPPAAAVSAEPKAGPDEMCEAAREDGEPVRREQFADVKPAEVCSEEPAGTSEDAPPPEPIAEVAFVGQQEAKRGLDLALSSPMVLFAGNLAYEAGADILLDAIITVCCSGDREALFLFAGEGGMRHEMQKRVSGAGLERRCRFLGDVPASDFDRVLRACDFVVIPGRVPQGEDLARMAVANGKPVLTTHQAAIGGVVVHGRNGLIAYDNPHSLVWGIRELLGPVYANLRREVKAAA